MSTTIARVEYFHTIVRDQPGEAFQLLSHLKSLGVNLLAFSVVSIGGESSQLILFPDHPDQFSHVAREAQMSLVGPLRALMVQGDDELGALVDIHRRLYEADVNVESSVGVTNGRGGYGYVIYVRDEDYNRAAEVLGL